MQANWSLIFNVVLLFGVIFAIFHVLQTRRKASGTLVRSPSIGLIDAQENRDDTILAVRRVTNEPVVMKPILKSAPWPSNATEPVRVLADGIEDTISLGCPLADASQQPPADEIVTESTNTSSARCMGSETPTMPLVMFLLAKSNRQLAGYELLQAVLSAGLRFGEGNLFHRHQHTNGQGTVMCSLAAATDEGVFDLQNIGAFTVHGLCLYMHASGNPGVDEERFDIMLDTAKILSDDLDTYLLDDRRQPLSEISIQRYHQALHLVEEVF